MGAGSPTKGWQGIHTRHLACVHTQDLCQNISMETKCHRQTYLWCYITCNVRQTYQPLPPPPRGDNVSWTALQPPCTPSQPQPWPLQPQPPDTCPQSTHPASTAHAPP